METEREITFYSDDQGVTITNTRLVISNTTYAMANITSVKTDKVLPDYSGPWFVAAPGLGILGLGIWTIFSLHSFGLFLICGGLFVFGIGVLWAWLVSPQFHLRISSAAGESSALSSWDKAYIEKIDQAIRQAIIHRG